MRGFNKQLGIPDRVIQPNVDYDAIARASLYRSPYGQTAHPTIHDSVMIHVNQTDSQINAGVQALEAVYQNTNPQGEGRVKYQIAYFNFPLNDQPDVGTAEFNLAILMSFTNSLTDMASNTQIYNDYTTCPYIKVTLPTTGTLNADELAQMVQTHIISFISQFKTAYMYNNEQLTTPKHVVVAAFCDMFENFYFDGNSQKYVLVVRPGDLSYPDPSNVGNTMMPSRIVVALRTFSVDQQDQNLARMLGANTTTNQVYQDLADSTITYTGYYTEHRSSDFFGFQGALANSIGTQVTVSGGLGKLPAPTYMASNQQGLCALHGPNIPQFYQSKYIYVHTTCASGSYIVSDQYGNRPSKSDILAVLPRINGVSDSSNLSNMYFPTTLLAVTDTISSVRNLRLTLTDEFNNMLTFSQPYQIGIIITPDQHLSTEPDKQ